MPSEPAEHGAVGHGAVEYGAIEFVRADPGSAAVARALNCYADDLVAAGVIASSDRDQIGLEAVEFVPPRGVLLTGICGSEFSEGASEPEIWAMGGVRLLDPGTAELKRMWVLRNRRGLGYGRTLLDALEAEATKLGARRVVLDTAGPLTQAIALYRSSGFVEVQPYNDNPDCTLWFGKPLADGEREPIDPTNSRRTREPA